MKIKKKTKIKAQYFIKLSRSITFDVTPRRLINHSSYPNSMFLKCPVFGPFSFLLFKFLDVSDSVDFAVLRNLNLSQQVDVPVVRIGQSLFFKLDFEDFVI